ncbi:ABC transporter substrate-binding protein [Betaproteobacteria bacterium]|nr:ABC transporter substrate-binding protein [Betaproteobacteria bacterium]
MRKIGRLMIAALLVSVGAVSSMAASAADDWKFTRKITFISPWGPGGGSGPTIRNITPLVQEVLGVTTEVQHIEGAGGANGAIAAEKQPADGYTFLMATQSQILLDLQKRLPYNFHDTFIPVGKLVHSTNGIMASAARAKGKYTDFKSFLEYIKANPRQVSIAMLSAGGTDSASLNQVLALSLKVPMTEVGKYVKIVSYPGGAEIDSALVGGHVDASVGGPGDEAGLIESGDVLPLVVMAEKRLASFPNIPSTGEMGIAAYIGTWRGIWAKKGTPQGAIDAMEAALKKAHAMKPYQDFCEQEGYSERTGFEGQADFKKLVDSDYVVFEEFLKASGLIK